MAIIVDRDTKLVVQGLTGSEGSFHGTRNKRYGTQVVAGVTPGKAGQNVEGIPVFDTVADAVAETGANTTMVFVPARFAGDAIYEAVDSGIDTVIWARREDLADAISTRHENPDYLPNVELPASLVATHDMEKAVAGAS